MENVVPWNQFICMSMADYKYTDNRQKPMLKERSFRSFLHTLAVQYIYARTKHVIQRSEKGEPFWKVQLQKLPFMEETKPNDLVLTHKHTHTKQRKDPAKT